MPISFLILILKTSKKMTVENLYNYVKSSLPKDKKAYLFFDEIKIIRLVDFLLDENIL